MHINSALKIEFFKARHRIVHALLRGAYSKFEYWLRLISHILYEFIFNLIAFGTLIGTRKLRAYMRIFECVLGFINYCKQLSRHLSLNSN